MRECSRKKKTEAFLENLPAWSIDRLLHDWELWARDDQLAPQGDWTSWLVLGGRGAGKTRAGAEWVRAQALAPRGIKNPAATRIALVGETLGDVRSVMIEGVSGLLAIHADHERPYFEPSKRQLTWPGGAVAQIFSADDPESLRGPQFSHAWLDELAKWRHAERAWDMLQFRDAELTGRATYDLSVLLRGQAGSEGAMRDPLGAGARFVLLDSAVAQVDMTADEIALDFNWKFGPASRDISHSSYQDRVRGFTGLGLKPLSPVHIRARAIGNDLEISWIRRTRVGGDSWETTEVPLGEETEAYEVDILDGSGVKRTLATPVAKVVYSEADQIADWGVPPSALSLRVQQLSASHGRGHPKEMTVHA